RTVQLPTGNVLSFARLQDGRFVISAEMHGRQTVGRPLHVLSPAGLLQSSFGVDRPEVRPDMPHATQRLVAVASDGTIWSVRRTDYVLEQWDRTGKRLAELRREAAWFPSHGRGGFIDRDIPPNPTINAFWIDDAGRAWIGIEGPEQAWRAGIVCRGVVQGIPRWGVATENEYFDTVIEVVDLERRVVVAQGRMEAALSSARLRSYLITYGESTFGTQLIQVWRPRIDTQPEEVP